MMLADREFTTDNTHKPIQTRVGETTPAGRAEILNTRRRDASRAGRHPMPRRTATNIFPLPFSTIHYII